MIGLAVPTDAVTERATTDPPHTHAPAPIFSARPIPPPPGPPIFAFSEMVRILLRRVRFARPRR